MLLASCYAYDAGQGRWSGGAFLDADPVNTVGSVFASMDSLIASNPALVNETLGGGQRQRQRLLGEEHPAHRHLALQLQPLPQRPTNASQQQLTLNILAPSAGAAEFMRAALLDDTSRAIVQSAVAGATGALNLTAAVASVRLITLTYRRSYWALLWAWFAQNIRAVLACACTLMALTLLLSYFNAWKAARALAAGRQRAAGAAAKLKALHSWHLRTSARAVQAGEAVRWERVRQALLRELRRRLLQRAAAGEVAGGQRAARVVARVAAAWWEGGTAASARPPALRGKARALAGGYKAKSLAGIGRVKDVLQRHRLGGGGDAVLEVGGQRRGPAEEGREQPPHSVTV